VRLTDISICMIGRRGGASRPTLDIISCILPSSMNKALTSAFHFHGMERDRRLGISAQVQILQARCCMKRSSCDRKGARMVTRPQVPFHIRKQFNDGVSMNKSCRTKSSCDRLVVTSAAAYSQIPDDPSNEHETTYDCLPAHRSLLSTN